MAQSSRIGEFEENTFAETLSRIPSIFETTARAHIDLAQQLKDHLELPLDGFLKDQRDIRKVVSKYHQLFEKPPLRCMYSRNSKK